MPSTEPRHCGTKGYIAKTVQRLIRNVCKCLQRIETFHGYRIRDQDALLVSQHCSPWLGRISGHEQIDSWHISEPRECAILPPPKVKSRGAEKERGSEGEHVHQHTTYY